MVGAEGGQAIPDLSRVLPDPRICRTRRIGLNLSIADCLVDRPNTCPHVIFSGLAQYCTYPNWQDFLRESGNGMNKQH